MTNSRLSPLIALLVGVAALAGCAMTASEPTPTPTTTVTPTPTPTPTPEPTLTTLTMGPESLIATDQNGATLAELVYSAPDPATIETLTALWGFEPTTKEVRRGVATDAFSGTVFTWEGFSIAWFGKWVDEPGSGLDSVNVSISAASARGVAMKTLEGVAVGQMIDFAAQYPGALESGTTPDGVAYTFARTSCIPYEAPEAADAADCVAISALPADGPITSLSAPYAFNHGL